MGRRKVKHQQSAMSGVKSLEIEAVKILADGTRVPLGVISTWHRNPVIRFWRRAKRAVLGRF
jgi:hypothetical protein